MEKKVLVDNDYYTFECPHCDLLIIVHKSELNCKIFRHGFYKNDNIQIDPHMPEIESQTIKDKIYGCGKQFEYIVDKNIVKCCTGK